MKQDALITYSSLIPGGLHYIPGGFDPPVQKRIRPEDLPPEPLVRTRRSPPTPPALLGRACGRSMPLSSPGLSPGPYAMSLSAINSSGDRRRGCDAQSES